MRHKTRIGKEIEISDMSDKHLLNTVAMMRKKAKEGIILRYGGGTTAEDMWYDEDHIFGDEALKKMGFDSYKKELEIRGLKEDKQD